MILPQQIKPHWTKLSFGNMDTEFWVYYFDPEQDMIIEFEDPQSKTMSSRLYYKITDYYYIHPIFGTRHILAKDHNGVEMRFCSGESVTIIQDLKLQWQLANSIKEGLGD